MIPSAISNGLQAVFAAWNRKAETNTYRAYELALNDLTKEQFEKGILRAIRSSEAHPPSAGQLRALCLGRSTEDIQAAAEAAFERADRFAREEGVARHPRTLGDPLLVFALSGVGGWPAFCRDKPDQWQKKNFIQTYTDAANNPQIEEVAKISHEVYPPNKLTQISKKLSQSLDATKTIERK